MGWNAKGIDHDRLAALLRAVEPNRRTLASRVGDELGVFKGIDSSGNVWLVEYTAPYTDERGHHVVRRARRMAYKAEEVERIAGMAPAARSKRRSSLFDEL